MKSATWQCDSFVSFSSASLLIKQLDGLISRAKVCRDLFTTEAIELRNQLCMLCAKSIIADPLQCRKKAEELLWKKCYYDVISSAKILSKVKQLKNNICSISNLYFSSTEIPVNTIRKLLSWYSHWFRDSKVHRTFGWSHLQIAEAGATCHITSECFSSPNKFRSCRQFRQTRTKGWLVRFAAKNSCLAWRFVSLQNWSWNFFEYANSK